MEYPTDERRTVGGDLVGQQHCPGVIGMQVIRAIGLDDVPSGRTEVDDIDPGVGRMGVFVVADPGQKIGLVRGEVAAPEVERDDDKHLGSGPDGRPNVTQPRIHFGLEVRRRRPVVGVIDAHVHVDGIGGSADETLTQVGGVHQP